MIKPDAMRNGHAGAILDKIIKEGFKIIALKQTKLSIDKAGEFYAVHKERPFYGELTAFMSSGAIIAAILEKDGAVADFRKLIGATDPSKAPSVNYLRHLWVKMPYTAATATRTQKLKAIFSSAGWSAFNGSDVRLFTCLPVCLLSR